MLADHSFSGEYRMATKKAVTIKDIAKKVNVSVATVGNALSGAPNVSEKTREQILKVAGEMGYSTNYHARALGKKGIKIALLFPEEPVEFTTLIVRGMEERVDEIRDYGIDFQKYFFHDNMAADEASDCVRAIRDEHVDGILYGADFAAQSYIDRLAEYVQKEHVPVFRMDRGQDVVPGIGEVHSDSEAMGRLAAEFIHMFYGKKAHVGVISTNLGHANHVYLLDSFKQDCEKYGIDVKKILFNDDSKAKTYAATKTLLQKYPDINLIYVTSYDSVSACRCIENMKMQHQVKVLSHDIHRGMLPYLEKEMIVASIYQNPKLQGRIAIDRMVSYLLGNRDFPRSNPVRPELVLRSNVSCYLEANDCG